MLCTHVPLQRQPGRSPQTRSSGTGLPLPAKNHARLFGVIPVPRIGAWATGAVLRLLLVCLAYATLNFLHPLSGAAPSTLTWRYPLFGVATVLSLLYFAQARTHGLVHNKADTVPWVFAILATAPDGEICATVRMLLGCVYLSSGVLKMRLTGVKWAKGESLALVMQIMLGHAPGANCRGSCSL